MSENKYYCPIQGGDKYVYCEGPDGNPKCQFFSDNSLQCIIFEIATNIRDIPTALSFLGLQLRQPMKPMVQFTDHQSFIDELRTDQMVIYRSIVRGVIKVHNAERQLPPVYEAYSAYIAGDQIIKLSKDCGEDFEAATKIMKEIEEACIDVCVSFRPGVMKEG